MCSICTTSYGPDRYGPQYAGRYGFQGNTPGATPWMSSDPNCPGCRVGAFSAGDARPPMPLAQKTMAAGQASGSLQPGSHSGLLPFAVPPGTYVAWLAHNRISCDRWSQMSRAQKIQTIRNLLFGDRARDAYNAQFLAAISNLFGVYALSPFRYETALLPSSTGATGTAPKASVVGAAIQALTGNVSPRDDHTEAAIGRLSNLVDADCLHAAVSPNVPHVSAVSTAPVPRAPRPSGQVGYPVGSYYDPMSGLAMAPAYPVRPFGQCPPGTTQTIAGACLPHPAGQALNGGPIPSSMAKYAQGGRAFNKQPTLGTPMPLAFPLGFLPVGAGLGYPRGQLPMSAPAPILKPLSDWFGALLGSKPAAPAPAKQVVGFFPPVTYAAAPAFCAPGMVPNVVGQCVPAVTPFPLAFPFGFFPIGFRDRSARISAMGTSAMPGVAAGPKK